MGLENLALAWVLWVVLGEPENDHIDVREDPVYGVCLEGVWGVLGGVGRCLGDFG